jgi:O-antigen ligase
MSRNDIMIFFYWLLSIMPLERHPLWSRFFLGLSLFKYAGALCVLYALLYLAIRRRLPHFFATWQARFFLLFYFMSVASYVFKGNHADFQMSPMFSYTCFLLLFFVTLTIVDSLKRLRWSLLVAVGSMAFASLYVLREWQKSGMSMGYRPGWIVGDPNYFAVSVLLCLPIGFYILLERERPRWERLYCLGCLALTIPALILGASRGGFIGLTAAFLFAVWRSRRRLRNLIIAGLLVIPPALLAPSSPLRRLFRPTWADRMSATQHWELLRAGLRMVASNPVFGVGLGNFKPRVEQYASLQLQHGFIAHNSYLEVAAEMGIPALVVYLLLVGFSLRTLGRIRRQTLNSGPRLLHRCVAGIEAGFLGASIALIFVSAQYQKLYWFMIFLSMGLPPLVEAVIVNQKEPLFDPKRTRFRCEAVGRKPAGISVGRSVLGWASGNRSNRTPGAVAAGRNPQQYPAKGRGDGT